MAEILARMNDIGLKQVDLLVELRERGIAVQPPELSQVLRGIYTYPKAKKVLAACEAIVTEHERSVE